MGVFKIARAEFIKIFKKPSVYIMGVILATVLVLSLLFFEPIGKQDYSVKLTGSSVGVVYNKFVNDETSPFKKSDFDKIIDDSLLKLDFYSVLNQRTQSLQKVNSEFSALFVDLQNAVKANESEEKINRVFSALKLKLEEYRTLYNNLSSLTTQSTFYAEYVKLPLFTDVSAILDKIVSDSAESANSFINRINNNKYIDALNKVAANDDNSIRNAITDYAKQIEDKTNRYTKLVYDTPQPSYKDQYTTRLNELTDVVKRAQTFLTSLFKNSYSLAFFEKKEYDELITALTSVISNLNSFSDPNSANTSQTDHERHIAIAKSLVVAKLDEKLAKFAQNLTYYRVSQTIINDLKTKINDKIIKDLKANLTKHIEESNNDATSADLKKIAALNDLITSYRVLANNTKLLVDYTLDIEATSQFGPLKITNYYNFDKFNTYETKEAAARINYFVSNGVYNQHYADVFAFNKNSTLETNAYDFMFYAMKIATVLISAFAILMAASLIALEYDSGTIKLLAIRPFKRWKIITGKLFATMFFVIVFVLFSATIALVAGMSIYPVTTTPVLMVINSQYTFAINPAYLMAIYICLTIAEIFFYAILALSISTIFRSYTAAISLSFLTFILAFTLNMLLGGVFWYSFIPFINTDFFRFFGGSFLLTQTGLLNDLFTPALLSNANIYVSLGIYFGSVFLLLILAQIVFNARDF